MRTRFDRCLCKVLPVVAAGLAVSATMLLICDSRAAFASPFANIPQALTQPSGETFSCLVSGDEFYHWLHDADADLALLAAAYGFGLTQNHPYRDGNKRVAFMTMVVFLGLNGFDLDAPDAEIVTVMVSVAAGHTSESHLAGWLRRRMTPLK